MPVPGGIPRDATVVDELLDTLRHPIRRDIVAHFEDQTTTTATTIDELTTHQAEQMPTSARECLSMELQQIHLSKLQSRGWLDYDSRSGEIAYHGHPRAAQVLGDLERIFAD